MNAFNLMSLEKFFRPILFNAPEKFTIKSYSKGRKKILENLDNQPLNDISLSENISSELGANIMGLNFRTQVMNAAGMFKNIECYNLAERLGAGGYVGGTLTLEPREGVLKEGIQHPFLKLPESHSSLNKLGLPNKGIYNALAEIYKIKESGQKNNFPLGVSLSYNPDVPGEVTRLSQVVYGMNLCNMAGADFIELNESCPNTKKEEGNLENRLKFISENFMNQQNSFVNFPPFSRNISPVVVKFSNDTNPSQVPELVGMLIHYGFNGVNFGNTSTKYKKQRNLISEKEKKYFDYFTKKFGGGISGRPLKESSLELASEAVRYAKPRDNGFAVIRTGGIETADDIYDSLKAGIDLVQWYTGFMEGLARDGINVYQNLYKGIEALRNR